MRVVHVAPTPFGAGGLFGGGERYPLALARALAGSEGIDCGLLSFGRGWCGNCARHARIGGHPAQPLVPGPAAAVRGADVIHTHQVRSVPSQYAAWVERAGTVVTTDHGLGGPPDGGGGESSCC